MQMLVKVSQAWLIQQSTSKHDIIENKEKIKNSQKKIKLIGVKNEN